VHSLTLLIHDNAHKSFGIKTEKTFTKRHYSNKWFDQSCKIAKENFKKARNTYLKHKTQLNRDTFITHRTLYNKAKYKAKRMQKTKEGKQICELAKHNTKQFWREINKYKKAPNKSCKEDISLDSLFDHFKTVFDTNEQLNNNIDQQEIKDDDLDSEIKEEELKHAIFSQKDNKSPGPDQLYAEYFKASYDIIQPILLNLYNRLFIHGEYPSSWGEGIINPIFKGGDKTQAKNYRGITLINILSKIYSQILLNRLTLWATKNNTLNDVQYGFQKGKSTVDCIFLINSIISKTLSCGKKLYCVFLDYEKAFDRVDRVLLWQKLLTQNVSTKFVKAVTAMYSSVRSYVRHSSKLSEPIISNVGLKQGDPSSPLLYMLFVNDILESINSDLQNLFSIDTIKLFIILYADDTVIFSLSPDSLQSILNDIELYCNTWGLKINTSKTKVVIFEKGRHTSHDFILNNEILEIVTSFKYLGVELYKNGNWHRTQQKIALHGQRSLHNLFRITSQVTLPLNEICNLFDTLVSPVLNYSSEVWGNNQAKSIELIHTKFCRKILCVKKSTNLSGLYGELGRMPLLIQRQINVLKYWVKILKLPNENLLKKVYQMLKRDTDNNNSYNGHNWAYNIKTLLENLGLSEIWLNHLTIDIPLHFIIQRLKDTYIQSWISNIDNASRLSSYCRYKHKFTIEPYLNFLNDKYRIALTKFRLSSHSLAIETGRYQNIPQHDRKCNLCNLNAIENEYHFLLVCPKFIDLRRKYFKPYFCHWPSIYKFDNLMSSSNKKNLINLSKYIYCATKLRQQAINN
jgi:hypothetical protein